MYKQILLLDKEKQLSHVLTPKRSVYSLTGNSEPSNCELVHTGMI